MKESTKNTAETLNPWFFITIGQKIQTLANSIVKFAQQPSIDIPDNEAGELIKRYLAHQSWFDRLSAKWSKTHFLTKVSWIAVTASACAVVGVFLGSPLILALSALTLSLLTHSLLITHETHRMKGAKLFAAEHIELTQVLTDSQDQLNEANKTLDLAVETVKEKSREMDSGLQDLEKERERLQAACDILDGQVSKVEIQTNQMVSQEKKATQALSDWEHEVNRGKGATCSATETVNVLERSAAEFSQCANDTKQSQKAFSKAVSQFSLFVENQPSGVSYVNEDLDCHLQESNLLNDECEAILARLTAVR